MLNVRYKRIVSQQESNNSSRPLTDVYGGKVFRIKPGKIQNIYHPRRNTSCAISSDIKPMHQSELIQVSGLADTDIENASIMVSYTPFKY